MQTLSSMASKRWVFFPVREVKDTWPPLSICEHWCVCMCRNGYYIWPVLCHINNISPRSPVSQRAMQYFSDLPYYYQYTIGIQSSTCLIPRVHTATEFVTCTNADEFSFLIFYIVRAFSCACRKIVDVSDTVMTQWALMPPIIQVAVQLTVICLSSLVSRPCFDPWLHIININNVVQSTEEAWFHT